MSSKKLNYGMFVNSSTKEEYSKLFFVVDLAELLGIGMW